MLLERSKRLNITEVQREDERARVREISNNEFMTPSEERA